MSVRAFGQTLVRDYRAFVYGVVLLLILVALGAVLGTYPQRIADWTPVFGDPQILRESAGLLGAAAVVLAFCLVVVAVLWVIISIRSE